MCVEATDEIRHDGFDCPIDPQNQVLIVELDFRLMVSPVIHPREAQDTFGKAICCGALNINDFACSSAAACQWVALPLPCRVEMKWWGCKGAGVRVGVGVGGRVKGRGQG